MTRPPITQYPAMSTPTDILGEIERGSRLAAEGLEKLRLLGLVFPAVTYAELAAKALSEAVHLMHSSHSIEQVNASRDQWMAELEKMRMGDQTANDHPSVGQP